MRILITGGAGFIGSNLALLLKKKYPGYHLMCLDSLLRRGSELNLSRLQENGIEFIRGDARNKKDLEKASSPDIILDAAGDPSVLAGITSSIEEAVGNNFTTTLHCLELARACKSAVIFLSTSRVYPIASLEAVKYVETGTRFDLSPEQKIPGVTKEGISEDFPLSGARSFYGATKLSSELLIQEYHQFEGLKTVINRCGVIAGPWQMGKADQGILTLWVARHYWKKGLSYFGYGGEGKQVRDILHIEDLFRLIDLQIHQIDKLNGRTFNVGGGRERSVSLKELTALCREVSGNNLRVEKVAGTREADVRIYVTDNRKVKEATGWSPERSVTDTVKDVYQWIQKNETLLRPVLEA